MSHAKHGQIREICEIRVPYYLEIRVSGLLEELTHTDLTDLTDLCLRLFLIMILRFLMMH